MAGARSEQPVGVFIRTPDVDAVAARVDDLIRVASYATENGVFTRWDMRT
jgi:hypothetical protein